MTEIPPYSNFRSYQIRTRQTVQTYLSKQERHYQNTIGLIGEVSEVVELLLTNGGYQREEIIKELGDCLWYMSRLLDDWDLDMQAVAKCQDTGSFGMSFWVSELKMVEMIGFERNLKFHARNMVSLAGKISEHLKKHFFQKHEIDLYEIATLSRKLLLEMAMVAFLFNHTMEDVAEKNLIKSAKRYPNGFDANNSIYREDETN